MTTPESDAGAEVPQTECRICKTDVPAGEYCGLCGCHLTPRPGEGPDWLRIKDFGAAPDEHLLKPSLASSLFPHLPARSRTVFRIGLAVVLVALIASALLRLPAALVAVASLGLPFLFLLYLHESDGFADIPRRTWVLTAALGIGLGVGWVLLTGAMVAKSYGIALGAGVIGARMLQMGIGIPLGGVILMLMPAVIVRLLRPPTREALDGFMIGALGALMFTAAATLTRLAPQFGSGVVSRRPMDSLLVEAGIRGVAVPLTAAAAGGLIGAALWFKRPPSKEKQHPGIVRALLVAFAVAVLAVYLGLGLIDVAHFPQVLMLVLYLALAMLALLLLRVGLHLALLHEAHDEIQSDEPLLCPHCGHVVPDMAFCPACGVATRASSRSSRTARREQRPVHSNRETDGS
ncbi:MAG TPA: zinc ribbon domain-containing protein [Mycobacterium sp.]|jgi:hypothetical protein|nr:zinc ribbon domain-containing protein [Mycobacterium sp.]